MTVAVADSGSQTATISTEHDLTTQTSPGTFVLCLDAANLAAGDVVVLRVYGKARTGDTERLLYRGTYGPVPPAAPLLQSLPIVTPHHARFTLTQTAGTGRAFPWAVYSL